MKKLIWILLGAVLLWNCKEENGGIVAPEGVVSEFTDARDSKVYRCVTIGEQTWMAENLAYRLPMGSIDGCFTYLEGVVETDKIEITYDDFLEAIQQAIDEGRYSDDMGMLGFILSSSSTIDGFFVELKSWIEYDEEEYDVFGLQPAWDFSEEIRKELKPSPIAIAEAVETELTSAEEDNGAYSSVNGFLYTYEAAQKVIPEGWRLPTDEDWKKLEAFLGMNDKELDVLDEWRDDGAGRLLKDEHTGFNVTYGGAKAYGRFNPSGRNPKLYCYINKGTNAYFWSSSKLQQNDSTQVAIIRSVSQWDDRILRGTSNLEAAYSIRCIKE
ncbi:MAG: fibrobacter succinogenes major paralogous domain-containing protein [Odoribacter sp.]|nr:fibrobacter succinogenes major paralogous domain-containing protein [Odoribacter sp.]